MHQPWTAAMVGFAAYQSLRYVSTKVFIMRRSATESQTRRVGAASRARARLARAGDFEPAPRLVAHRLLERQRPLLVRRQAIGAEASLREARELVRQRDRRRARLAGRYEPVHESHAERLVADDAAAGEDEIERVAHADETRETDGPEIAERDAEAPAVDAEDRVGRGHAEVAPE